MMTDKHPKNTARHTRCRPKSLLARTVRKLWTTNPIVPVIIGVSASGTVIM